MKSEERVTITYDEVVHTTEKAMLVKVGEDEMWLPLSQIEDDNRSGGSGSLSLPEWLAIEKGLV